MKKLTLDNFVALHITLNRALNQAEESIDLGGIRLSVGDRFLGLDTGQVYHYGAELTVTLDRDLEALLELFESDMTADHFDLTVEDLSNAELCAEVWTEGEGEDNTQVEWAIRAMHLELVDVPNLTHLIVTEA
jgi:hypothetical protein